MILVEIRNLTVDFSTYDGIVKALDHVSFEINEGETVGLVGESGCGKTITSRAIVNLLPPNAIVREGSVQIRGHGDVLQKEEKDLVAIRGAEISLIFQEPARALNPTSSIGTQVSEPLLLHKESELLKKALQEMLESRDKSMFQRLDQRIKIWLLQSSLNQKNHFATRLASRIPFFRGYRKAVARVALDRSLELLRQVGVPRASDVLLQFPHELSGGMRQRVMIAMALATRPRLIIADEPTTALDVTTQLQILRLLKALKADIGMTLLLITHNLGIVSETCDRAIVMYAGTVAEEATVGDLFKQPLHPYTKGLLNAIHRIGDREAAEEIGGTVPNLISPPSGCRFHPRCPYAEEMCRRERPELIEVEKEHKVACFPVQRQYGKIPR